MPSILVDEVKAHLLRTGRRAQLDELLVQGPEGAPLRKKWHPRYFMPAVKRAGLDPLTFHGLRHTYAGLLIATGAHAKAIQQRMGHSSIQVTFDVYGHVLPDIDEHITTALDALLRAAPANKPRTTTAGLARG